jgi:type II secretory pathway predicted ATPase ExeA
VNPYAPGQPADPRSFAGRRELLRQTVDAVEVATKLQRSTAILLHGYRGSGKTSILRKIQDQVLQLSPNSITVELPLRSMTPEDRLLASLVLEVTRQLGARKSVTKSAKEFLARVNGLTIPGGFGISLGEDSSTRAGSALALWRDCVESLEGIPLVVISIDDAELLDPSGLGALKTIAEAHSTTPVILLVTGGVEFSDRLAQADASPVARIFSGSRFDVGGFSEPETREALESPLAALKLGGKWTEGAAAEVHRMSHGYPYLVQCIAHAAYSEGGRIDEARVAGALDKALAVASSWLQRECADASDQDIVSFALIGGTGKSVLRSSEIQSLGVQAPYIGRLVRQKVLLKVSRGHYEVRKAPVIAYYHMLRRKLTLPEGDR